MLSCRAQDQLYFYYKSQKGEMGEADITYGWNR